VEKRGRRYEVLAWGKGRREREAGGDGVVRGTRSAEKRTGNGEQGTGNIGYDAKKIKEDMDSRCAARGEVPESFTERRGAGF
jgi:hypothetical protein